jgi:hypothetical protein
MNPIEQFQNEVQEQVRSMSEDQAVHEVADAFMRAACIKITS